MAVVPPSVEGLDQSRAIRILSVRKEGADTIVVQYQAVKRLDWLGTHYQGELRKSAELSNFDQTAFDRWHSILWAAMRYSE